MMRSLLPVVILTWVTSVASAQQPSSMKLPAEIRAQYRNEDGSCVQCSIGMCGAHNGDHAASLLLENSVFGPAVRGGSWPSRVRDYCDARRIHAYNVTAVDPRDTIAWAKWAAETGRFAAIGLNRAHFQTVYGYEPGTPRPWLVCDNNSPQRIDRYTEDEFRARHAASGPWVVILKQPAPDPPRVIDWWSKPK